MTDQLSARQRVTQEALTGRLPVLSGERVYVKYMPFLWTCTTFAAATWTFLIGGYLPYVGNTLAGSAGYAVGFIIGMAFVTMASAFAPYKYGVETLDATKTAYGTRGMILPLICLLVTLLGWGIVVMALTARGAGNVIQQVRGSSEPAPEGVVIVIALLSLVLVWFLTIRGPHLFERLNNWLAPGHLIVTAIMLIVLLAKFGPDLFSITVPTEQMYTTDKRLGLAFAIEFGVASAFTWWPVMGGLSRLVKNRGHVVGPSVVGVGVLGSAVISTVAALAGAAYGTADPTIWMVDLGGRVLGSLIVLFVLVANVGTMIILMYMCGISIQHVKVLARVPYQWIIAMLLVPWIPFAFRTEWLLAEVMTWLTYDGLIFTGITSVMIVDYFLLRRQRLDLAGIFSKSPRGPYWFWGGVNWIAVVVTVGSVPAYLRLYDPVTMESHGFFKAFGAGLPVVVAGALVYWVAMRLIALPLGKGGYRSRYVSNDPAEMPARMTELHVGL
jgi:purine-cytosine permease-like protein